MPPICVPMGYGTGPYAVMAYAGYELCNIEAQNEVIQPPRSNVRDLCIVRC